MSTMLVAFNGTRENGNFAGDQLCYLKVAYLFVANQPDVDKVIMSLSPGNEMGFYWDRFLSDPRGNGSIPPVEVVWDNWNSGDWSARWNAWDTWRRDRIIEGRHFDHYRELALRVHGAQRQTVLCGHERGLGRKNIFEYVYYGQEHMPEVCIGADVYDVEIIHPPLTRERDVYISPHCKTQGNQTFTLDYWALVVAGLVDAGLTVTVGYDGAAGPFHDGPIVNSPLYKRHWGNHREWMEQICKHRIVACGNTGTGWLAAACGVPMITMEPHNSVMADHRYRECGLRNIVEVIDGQKLDEYSNMRDVAAYVVRRITDEVRRKVVMTTGCYDVLHAGHVRHLERSRALGTRLVVALNSDASVRLLKGPARPINPEGQRKAVLEALRCVDEVRVFDAPTPIEVIQDIRPDILTAGFGYKPEDVVGWKLVESDGGKVIITCQGDARDEPSTTKIVQRLRAADVVQICHLGASHSVNPLDKLRLMAEEFLSVAGLPGDVADLGSYRGGCALILRRLAPDKHLHLFDTWVGNPYDDPLCHHKRGEWTSSLEWCRNLVGANKQTYYHPGIFPESVPHYIADDSEFCFVYTDMDTERATRDAIEFFWPRMVQGGKMMFDDFGWGPCAGVKKAVDEAFGGETISLRRVVQSQYACIVEKL